MDITTICNNSFYEGNKVERRLPKMSYVNSLSKLAVLREKRDHNWGQDFKPTELDTLIDVLYYALVAVKLDPAVLEAQVTIENNKCSKAETENLKTEKKNKNDFTFNSKFEKAMSLQRAALFSLSSQQFNLLMKYVDTLRQQRMSLQKHMECAFCKNNGHPEVWFTTHALKDRKGRVKCPILRTLSCRRCGATGDQAHTIKYCPQM